MRKLYDDDGNEIEVPSEEELKALQEKAEKADKAEEYEKLVSSVRTALDIKEDDDITEAVKLAKEAANPNWKDARDKIKRLTDYAKANGANVDEKTGEVMKEEKLDPTKIAEEAKAAARQEIYQQQLSQKLSKYPEDKRQVVESYFKKLSAGEELNSEVIEKYVGEAESLTFPKGVSTPSVDGGTPNLDESNAEDFSNTQEGKQMAEGMNLPFTKEGEK